MAKKTYVLDTSVYLTNAKAIYEYKNNDIIVPMKVLEEIDKHKTRQDAVGHQARKTIRILDTLRERGSLEKGVRLEKGKGLIRVLGSDVSLLPPDLDPKVPDNKIISTALSERQSSAPSRKVILVTKDINMRVVCDSIGLTCETYDPEKAVDDRDQLYGGYSEILVDEEFVDRFYKGEVDQLPDGVDTEKYFPNEFMMFRAAGNEKKTALARYMGKRRVKRLKPKELAAWRVTSRNREQTFALELLLDPDVPVVTLVGRAGSGKTLCAIAAGLEQTLGEDPKYTRLVVSRPVQPLGKDLGFLPGDVNEKMLPWLMPIQDNLQFLMGNDKAMMEDYMNRGTIEIEALTYIRGRSISNAFIIIDEAQNLTMHELKTIITRVGEGTKIILTGDIEQIDNMHINDVTNGLTHAVEKFKHTDLAGHVTLLKGERSAVASLAAKVL